MTVFDDLAEEQERLEGILGGLGETQWTPRSRSHAVPQLPASRRSPTSATLRCASR